MWFGLLFVEITYCLFVYVGLYVDCSVAGLPALSSAEEEVSDDEKREDEKQDFYDKLINMIDDAGVVAHCRYGAHWHSESIQICRVSGIDTYVECGSVRENIA